MGMGGTQSKLKLGILMHLVSSLLLFRVNDFKVPALIGLGLDEIDRYGESASPLSAPSLRYAPLPTKWCSSV